MSAGQRGLGQRLLEGEEVNQSIDLVIIPKWQDYVRVVLNLTGLVFYCYVTFHTVYSDREVLDSKFFTGFTGLISFGGVISEIPMAMMALNWFLKKFQDPSVCQALWYKIKSRSWGFLYFITLALKLFISIMTAFHYVGVSENIFSYPWYIVMNAILALYVLENTMSKVRLFCLRNNYCGLLKIVNLGCVPNLDEQILCAKLLAILDKSEAVQTFNSVTRTKEGGMVAASRAVLKGHIQAAAETINTIHNIDQSSPFKQRLLCLGVASIAILVGAALFYTRMLAARLSLPSVNSNFCDMHPIWQFFFRASSGILSWSVGIEVYHFLIRGVFKKLFQDVFGPIQHSLYLFAWGLRLIITCQTGALKAGFFKIPSLFIPILKYHAALIFRILVGGFGLLLMYFMTGMGDEKSVPMCSDPVLDFIENFKVNKVASYFALAAISLFCFAMLEEFLIFWGSAYRPSSMLRKMVGHWFDDERQWFKSLAYILKFFKPERATEEAHDNDRKEYLRTFMAMLNQKKDENTQKDLETDELNIYSTSDSLRRVHFPSVPLSYFYNFVEVCNRLSMDVAPHVTRDAYAFNGQPAVENHRVRVPVYDVYC